MNLGLLERAALKLKRTIFVDYSHEGHCHPIIVFAHS
jgi:hypothetical protein